MTDKSNTGKWSIVMTGFSGDQNTFCDTVEQAIGRKGLSDALVSYDAYEHLPAELESGLTFETANLICSKLTKVGVTVETVLTDDLAGIRHRESELWAHCCVEEMCFAEIDGMILDSDPLNARKTLNKLQDRDPSSAKWEMECFINHIHPDIGDSPRQSIELELAEIQTIISSLRKCYPRQAFTISHIPTQAITFWQTAADSPKEEYPLIAPECSTDEGWCDECLKLQKFHSSAYSDPRFPPLKWGTCDMCGSDILVRSCEKLTFVTPEDEQEEQP